LKLCWGPYTFEQSLEIVKLLGATYLCFSFSLALKTKNRNLLVDNLRRINLTASRTEAAIIFTEEVCS
jgi:hypothetical protein